MNPSALEQLQYPIGKFVWDTDPTVEIIQEGISTIKNFPKKLNKVVSTLDTPTLLNRYRPEGWTIAQVVHHVADSHMHSYLRFKHALLEDFPSIKDYQEVQWAELPDAKNHQIDYSLDIISALHKRWVIFLEGMSKEDFKRSYFHPERQKKYPLDVTLLIYAWHCEHHLAHIKNAIETGY